MPAPNDILTTGFSRVFLLPNGPGPTAVPQYMGFHRAGSLSYDQGDSTKIYVPNEGQYNAFRVATKIRGQPGNAEMTLTGRYLRNIRSTLLQLARKGCDVDVHIHFGECTDPRDFVHGWQKKLILSAAALTNYSTDELGALGPDEQAAANEMVDLAAADAYELTPISFSQKALSQVVNEIAKVLICDSASCGACGRVSNGCQVVIAVTYSTGDSPGLPAQIVYSHDGGYTWSTSVISSLAAGDNPAGAACFGQYLVVSSGNTESLLAYTDLADVIDGDTLTWSSVNTGGGGIPQSVYAADSMNMWTGTSTGGIVYYDSITNPVVQVAPGDITSQALRKTHGSDNQNIVMVGDLNVLVRTRNGGQTWGLITGPSVGVNLTSIWMVNEYTWWVGNATGELYYTSDAGAHWTRKRFPSDGDGPVWDIRFANPSVGYLSYVKTTPSVQGRIYRTVDGGGSWVNLPETPGATLPVTSPLTTRFRSLAVCTEEPNLVWAGGEIGSTTDGILVLGE